MFGRVLQILIVIFLILFVTRLFINRKQRQKIHGFVRVLALAIVIAAVILLLLRLLMIT
ncbi:MAG: hypothetical protein IK065_03880 [Neisseriaceae bacterium]|nr:hypothetical protein [Neisseriaceae bacterium]